MKNSRSNPVRYGKIIAAEAILLTAGVHVLFCLLFTVPEERKTDRKKENTSVTLLRFSGGNQNQASLQNYIRQYAPTHFAGSSSPVGFGSFHTGISRKLPSLPELGRKNLYIFADPVSEVPVSVSRKIKAAPLLPPREIPGINAAVQQNMTYPFAVSDSGLVIPITFSIEEMRMINEFPLSAGIYKLLKPEKDNTMPRLILLRSCGRRALDKLGIKILYQEIHKLTQCADGETFTIYYRAPETPGDAI